MIPCYAFWKGKTIGRENKSVAARGWGLGEGLTTEWHPKGFSGVLEMFSILIVVTHGCFHIEPLNLTFPGLQI